MKLGKHKEALSDAELAIDADPDFVKGFLRRAGANMALENFEAAQNDYEKVTTPAVLSDVAAFLPLRLSEHNTQKPMSEGCMPFGRSALVPAVWPDPPPRSAATCCHGHSPAAPAVTCTQQASRIMRWLIV